MYHYLLEKRFSVLFSLLLIFSSSISLAVVPIFNSFGTADGLSTLSVRSISQDKTGYIWIGTINGLFKFDGYQFTKISIKPDNDDMQINSLFYDSQNIFWVGTPKNGLFRLKNNVWESINFANVNEKNKMPRILSITQATNGLIWIGTNDGLSYFSNNENLLIKEDAFKGKHISSLNSINDNELLIGSKGKLIFYDLNTMKITHHKFTKYLDATVHDTLLYQGEIWLATSKGLIKFDVDKKTFIDGPIDIQNTRVLNVLENHGSIWIATIDRGLFIIEPDKQIKRYAHSEFGNSLSDKYIKTIYISKDQNLWIGNFYNGLNHLALNSLAFNYETSQENSLSCASSSIINSFLLKSEDIIWLSTSDGLIEYNMPSQKCTLLNDNDISYILYSVEENKYGTWLSTSQGLKLYKEEIGEISDLNFKGVVYFTFENKNENENKKIYIATNSGLFEYIDQYTAAKIIENSKNIEIKSYTFDNNHKIYFLTSKGLSYLHNNKLKPFEFIDRQYKSSSFTSMYINKSNDIFLTLDHQLLHFSHDGHLIESYNTDNDTINGFTIYSILTEANETRFWLGTDKGLINYDLNSKKSTIFKNAAGSSTNLYLPNAAYLSPTDEMYFGTTTGFIHFRPSDIQVNMKPPSVVISGMKLLNKEVKVGKKYQSHFSLKHPVNQLDEITIGHQDYIIGFEFTTLAYSDSDQNNYAFRLKGLNNDWVNSDSRNRQTTYTNLSPGDYTFEVKASNKYGLWSTTPKQLKIKVLPAPWLTWWAFMCYALIFLAFLYWYWHRKNKESIRITKMLKSQVQMRTQELQVQKQTVEKLLARKNEMFANVSHEFRTPLTLILGPVNKLLNSRLHFEDIQALKMVNRNANRLLTMIEQLLLLAKISREKKIIHIPQLINHQILSIIEIFQGLAKEKQVSLKLLNNNRAAINATPNTIDTILGNLISNAVKYTPEGGEVTVNSYTNDGFVCIEVTDTGCGLNEEQKSEIFNRFKRLDSHANIDGVGIGLSVVEEMLKINEGEIEIVSEPGKGSQFKVRFTSIDATGIDAIDDKHLLVNQLAKNALLETENKQFLVESTGRKNNDTILIIEDNDDMRQHISDSLKNNFHCLLSDRGKAGIALALKHVPDAIICDVMMPEMDGFKVSRIIRSDTRTSHIPLIILTALHDKESRIKGWREHVDAYLTKPFDAHELLLQLNNVLVIRNILKKKAGHVIKAGKKASKSACLPKRDKNFVDKLNHLIAINYKNPIYQRMQLASDMAVSEKQLQRKLKAIIDKNPMELLREYRLQKASERLKDGYQVSITCDECGFSSLSHFSQCFKAHYGVSPKLYQQTCNDKI